MAKSKPHRRSDPARMPGGTGQLPVVRLQDFLDAQHDPKVRRALREARDEDAQLRHKGLIHE